MNNMNWKIGCISGALAIILGAFGAHSLEKKLDAYSLDIWKTGSFYHLVHSILIIICALAQANLSAKFFLIGIVLFSGGLYIIAVTGFKKLGMVVPIGGISFIVGWIMLFFHQKPT